MATILIISSQLLQKIKHWFRPVEIKKNHENKVEFKDRWILEKDL